MILRAAAVWFLLLALAVANGAAREGWLTPRLGDTAARAISTLTLSALIAAVAVLTIGWIRPSSVRVALAVGAFWLALTLGFEFLVGHFVLRKSWQALLADYDVSRGRIWALVLLVTALAPLVAAHLRGLLGGAAS